MPVEAARVPLGGALVFDCVSRANVLVDRLQDELTASQAALRRAFGAQITQFHNKPMVVMALHASTCGMRRVSSRALGSFLLRADSRWSTAPVASWSKRFGEASAKEIDCAKAVASRQRHHRRRYR
jgi:hypothetical protein